MWKMIKLGEICDFEGGSQPNKKEFIYKRIEGYERFLQIRDFKDNKNITYIPKANKNRLCEEDDILIGRYGASVGQILSGLSGAYNVAMMKAIPNEKVILKSWLHIYLSSTFFQNPLVEVSNRSAQNGFSKNDIYDFDVPLPPLSVQKKVSQITSSFDDLIEKIQLQINRYKNLKFSLIDDLLYQGIRNKKFKDTLIGKIPENWTVDKLGSFCNSVSDKNHKKSSNIKVLSMTKHDGFVESLKYFKKKIFSKDLSNYKIVKKNQFAYSTIHLDEGSIGLLENFEQGLISPMYTVFEANEKVLPKYLLLLLKSEKYIKKYSQIGQGSINRRMSVSYNDFSNLLIPVPSIIEQKKIVEIIDIIENNISNINKKKIKYEVVKKSLTNDFMNDKIKVPLN